MDIQDVKKIFVVGAGTMGSGLSQAYSEAGYHVTMYSRTQKTLDKAMELTRSSLQTVADADLLDAKQISSILGRIKTTTSLEEGARDADIVVETVAEDAEVKKKMFTHLDQLCPPRALLASNTSFLNIFDFVETNRPDKVLIAHWYAPPQLIPLVEVVKGPKTSDASVQLMADILRKMGKKPAIMNKVIPGFIINRLQLALQREAYYLVDNDYITPSEIDEAARWGLALRMLVVGILQRIDYAGIDISIKNITNPNTQAVPIDYKPRKIFELYEKGHLGVKSGKGWYDYSSKSQAEWNRERDLGLIKLLKALNLK
jgi:3-hydroxybutyryl-CoA dehydrogenase